MKIGIIGLGLIGTSLALAFKREKFNVWGMDIEESAVEYLLKKGVIDNGNTDLEGLSKEIKESEVIFISVYPSKIIDIIKKLKVYLNIDHILTDTASVKEKIINYVEEDDLLKRVFVGGHPLAGKEKSGYKEGEADLFKDKIYFLTPTSKIPQEKLQKIKGLIELIKAKPFIISSEEHDKILSFTSHLPQIISYIISLNLPKEYLEFTGKGFKDTTRLAMSSPNLWIDILKENKRNILEALENFQRVFKVFYEKIEGEDWEKLKDLFEESKKIRMSLR